MKLVTFTLALAALLPLAVQAMPTVGDSAFYEGTYDGQPAQERVTLTDYSADHRQFLKETIIAVGSASPQTTTEWVNEADLSTDQQMQDLLDHCAQYSGTPETISVPAGVMATCRVPLQRGGTANLGRVPFGIVSIHTVMEDGKSLVAFLSSYARGGR